MFNLSSLTYFGLNFYPGDFVEIQFGGKMMLSNKTFVTTRFLNFSSAVKMQKLRYISTTQFYNFLKQEMMETVFISPAKMEQIFEFKKCELYFNFNELALVIHQSNPNLKDENIVITISFDNHNHW